MAFQFQFGPAVTTPTQPAPAVVTQPAVSQRTFNHRSLAQKYFQLPDGDIVLECTTPRQAAATQTATPHSTAAQPGLAQNTVSAQYQMKVHRRILAAHSAFFESMIETSGPQASDTSDVELPKVQMEEDLAVINVLLGAAYNNSEVQAIITESRDWRFILKVWEAANKYGFQLLRSLATTLLLLNASTVDDDGALFLYTRASVFDDHILASHFLEQASHKPPHLLPIEILRQLPPRALSTLMQKHAAPLKDLDDALAAFIGRYNTPSLTGISDIIRHRNAAKARGLL